MEAPGLLVPLMNRVGSFVTPSSAMPVSSLTPVTTGLASLVSITTVREPETAEVLPASSVVCAVIT